MASEPRHREISGKLRAEIAAGKYDRDRRLPTEQQLVHRFKLSRPTVARALRDLADEGLIERRAGSGTFLRQPSAGVSGVADRQLGLLIPGLGSTEIFEVICGELAGVARVHDYHLLWGGGAHPRHDISAGVESMQQFCDHFIQKKIRGVFFAPVEHVENKSEINHNMASQLRQAGVAVVLLDRDLGDFGTRSDFDLVSIDNLTGGHMLATHLIKLGCRKPLFVARPLSAQTVILRAAGAREALRMHGIREPDHFLRNGDPSDPRFVESLDAGRSCDGVICSNDYTAAMLIQTFERMKIRVPRHVRVVGFDDVRYATLLAVPLTTVHQPCREIAITALNAMRDRIADPTAPTRTLMLNPRLVVRESCGAYLNAPAQTV